MRVFLLALVFFSQLCSSAEPVWVMKSECNPELYFFEVRIIRFDNKSQIGEEALQKHRLDLSNLSCVINGQNYSFNSAGHQTNFLKNDEVIISEISFSDKSPRYAIDQIHRTISSLQVWGGGANPLIFLDSGFQVDGYYVQKRTVFSRGFKGKYGMVGGVILKDNKLATMLSAATSDSVN